MRGDATTLALADDPEVAARTIAEAAAEFDAVVLGSHSGGLADRLLVGDVAGTVVRRSPVPVTVVR